MADLTGLGRLPQWDRRNLDYTLPKLDTARRQRFWNVGDVLDQGATPQCVGYAGYGWLLGGPVINKNLPFTPTDLYKWAQANDEWPGENYDGSSTLGLMKALQGKGYITEYRWALDADTLARWVLEKGPVLVGTTWFMDMFTPDNEQFIYPEGEDVGGHEWRITGINLDKVSSRGGIGSARMVNSWGRGWGHNGRAWIQLSDLDRLIKNAGEAVTATEVCL